MAHRSRHAPAHRSVRRVLGGAAAVACAIAGLASAPPAAAITYVWQGLGASSQWSFADKVTGATNWESKQLPTSGQSLLFTGTEHLANINDLAGLSVRAITFDGGAGSFRISGLALTSTGSIVNESAARQELQLALTVGADQTWSSQRGPLVVTGDVQIGPHVLTLSGAVQLDRSTSILNMGQSGAATLQLRGGASGSAEQVFASKGSLLSADGAGTYWWSQAVHLAEGSGLAATRGAYVEGGDLGLAIGAGTGALRASGAGTVLALSSMTAGNDVGSRYDVTVDAGAQVRVRGNASLSTWEGSGGTTRVSGPGTRWDGDGALIVGQRSGADMFVSDGAQVSHGMLAMGIATGTPASLLRISGAGSSVTLGGKFTGELDGALYVVGLGSRVDVLDGASLVARSTLLGDPLNTRGDTHTGFLRVAGVDSFASLGDVQLGQGRLLVEQGARVVTGDLQFIAANAERELVVRGEGTVLEARNLTLTPNPSAIGSGPARLTIDGGASLQVSGNLALDGGFVTIDGNVRARSITGGGDVFWNGGRFELEQFSVSGLGNVFDIGADSRRELRVSGTSVIDRPLIADSSRFSSTDVIVEHTLILNGTAAHRLNLLDSRGTLTVEGGGLDVATFRHEGRGEFRYNGVQALQAGEFDNGGRSWIGGGGLSSEQVVHNRGRMSFSGALLSTPQLQNDGFFTLEQGRNLTLNRLVNEGTLTLDQGARLDVTDMLSGSGLTTLRQDASLVAQRAAPMRGLVLFDGARAEVREGLVIDRRGQLEFYGDATIAGAVRVDGFTAGQGRLVMLGPVSGEGLFYTDGRAVIEFHGSFKPGARREGVDGDGLARVLFEDGNVVFDGEGEDGPGLLELQIGPDGHDSLGRIAQLSFRNGGVLRLRFADGFDAAVGTLWDLLDFVGFDGLLDAAHIEVAGFDRQRLDFSRLLIDGTLRVTGDLASARNLPEPGTGIIALAALLALARQLARRTAARGRRIAPCQTAC